MADAEGRDHGQRWGWCHTVRRPVGLPDGKAGRHPSAHGGRPRCDDSPRPGKQHPDDAADVDPQLQRRQASGRYRSEVHARARPHPDWHGCRYRGVRPRTLPGQFNLPTGRDPFNGHESRDRQRSGGCARRCAASGFPGQPIRFEPEAKPRFEPVSEESWNAEFSTGMPLPSGFSGAFPEKVEN